MRALARQGLSDHIRCIRLQCTRNIVHFDAIQRSALRRERIAAEQSGLSVGDKFISLENTRFCIGKFGISQLDLRILRTIYGDIPIIIDSKANGSLLCAELQTYRSSVDRLFLRFQRIIFLYIKGGYIRNVGNGELRACIFQPIQQIAHSRRMFLFRAVNVVNALLPFAPIRFVADIFIGQLQTVHQIAGALGDRAEYQ